MPFYILANFFGEDNYGITSASLAGNAVACVELFTLSCIYHFPGNASDYAGLHPLMAPSAVGPSKNWDKQFYPFPPDYHHEETIVGFLQSLARNGRQD